MNTIAFDTKNSRLGEIGVPFNVQVPEYDIHVTVGTQIRGILHYEITNEEYYKLAVKDNLFGERVQDTLTMSLMEAVQELAPEIGMPERIIRSIERILDKIHLDTRGFDLLGIYPAAIEIKGFEMDREDHARMMDIFDVAIEKELMNTDPEAYRKKIAEQLTAGVGAGADSQAGKKKEPIKLPGLNLYMMPNGLVVTPEELEILIMNDDGMEEDDAGTEASDADVSKAKQDVVIAKAGFPEMKSVSENAFGFDRLSKPLKYWTCKCGQSNEGKFCVSCGEKRPIL